MTQFLSAKNVTNADDAFLVHAAFEEICDVLQIDIPLGGLESVKVGFNLPEKFNNLYVSPRYERICGDYWELSTVSFLTAGEQHHYATHGGLWTYVPLVSWLDDYFNHSGDLGNFLGETSGEIETPIHRFTERLD
jgi:hypothetical protein